MSFSLGIENGDLALNGTSYGIVEGPLKVAQDLSCAVLTPMGSYEEHPTFGSAIDGGFTENGYQESVIGEMDWKRAASIVRAELNRICSDYQKQQLARNANDTQVYGRPTLTADEILMSVRGIQIEQFQDILFANITLNMGTEPIQVGIQLTGNE